ncbi:MAG: VanW family protein [Lachnospiraceae bacterium]|nr:VanW family protein [Lachnospiraceae bacterium]
MNKGRMKKRSRMFFAMLLSFLLIMGMGMSASAEEIIYGVPYATVIAVLKAEAPQQKLILKVGEYTFEKMMADFGTVQVVVQDNEDGSRICHIPDTSLLDAFVADVNVALSGVPAENDSFYYYDAATGTFQTYAGASCQQINETGAALIYQSLLEILANKGTEDKTVTLSQDQLDLVSLDIPEEILANKYSIEGSCSTSFRGSSSNRIGNIKVASSNINMLVLMPGEEVSMNQAFKPRTSANGYRLAGAYSGGKKVTSIGGGICQVSSTVYNAVMNSGLTVLERHAHSMPVHYLPLGMDAAISSGSKDLRVRNDYPFPVLFEAYTEGNRLIVNVYTNEILTAGTSYRLHAVRRGSLAASAYLEVTVNGQVVEDRSLGISRYSPLPKNDEEAAED